MTKEQEAQKIDRWSHVGYEEMTLYDDGVYVLYDDHKAIVDSQAQKIAEREKEIEILREAVKYDKYANLARIMKRPKDISVFTHKKAEALQKLHEFDESARLLK